MRLISDGGRIFIFSSLYGDGEAEEVTGQQRSKGQTDAENSFQLLTVAKRPDGENTRR